MDAQLLSIWRSLGTTFEVLWTYQGHLDQPRQARWRLYWVVYRWVDVSAQLTCLLPVCLLVSSLNSTPTRARYPAGKDWTQLSLFMAGPVRAHISDKKQNVEMCAFHYSAGEIGGSLRVWGSASCA